MMKLLALIHFLETHKWGGVGRALELLEHFVFCNSISAKAKIGAGTCVVHPKTEIGSKCTIFQHVTIGSKWSEGICGGEAPVIGDNVMIGAGACILGNIRIGNNAIIGCNAVVLHDVPANCVVAGNPAKIVKQHQ